MTSGVNWDRIRGVVFDVDGTLYDQRKLRLLMITEMLTQAAKGSFGPNDLRTIMRYRQCRERWAEQGRADLATKQYELAAGEIGRPASEIECLIEDWMNRRPLYHMKRCRFEAIDVLFDRLKGRGIKVGAFSDYPVAGKLAALDLRVDAMACALEPTISRLKPHTAILAAVTERLSIDPTMCLVIGDRDERDGACARGLGAQFVRRRRRLYADLAATL